MFDTARLNWLAPPDPIAPNAPVTPAGSPDTLRLTVPENPLCEVIWMLADPLDPAATDTAVGVAESPNEGPPGDARSLINAWPVGVPHPVARS